MLYYTSHIIGKVAIINYWQFMGKDKQLQQKFMQHLQYL